MLSRWPILYLHLSLQALCLLPNLGCGRYGFGKDAQLLGDAGFGSATDPVHDDSDDMAPSSSHDAGALADASVPGGEVTVPDASLADDPPPARFDCQGKAGVLMCSTFDDPSLSEWTEPRQFNGQSVASEGALIASTGLTGGVAAVYRTLPGFGGKDLYLRATLKLPADYDLTRVDLAMLGEAPDNNDTCLAVSVLSDGMLALSMGNERLPRTSNYALPRDRWFCLAAHIVLDAKAGSVQIAVDGVERFRADGLDTQNQATMNMVGVGIHWSSLLQVPAIVLADDFVLSTVATPCETP